MADWAKQRPGGLAAVLGLSEPDVRAVCDEVSTEGNVGVAGVNAPGQTVIAGELGPLQQAMALARERGGRVMRLPISVPGHLPVMEDAARELGRFIDAVPFRDPDTPIVSNVSARILTTAAEVREELSDQLCSAVQWARCVMTMANNGAGHVRRGRARTGPLEPRAPHPQRGRHRERRARLARRADGTRRAGRASAARKQHAR